jgi:hypothetical protein
LLAALGVATSVGIEIYAGNRADDVADQIRANLQERVIAVSPRFWVLSTAVQDELAVNLKAFAGQRVAITTNARQLKFDPYGEIPLTQTVIARMLDESKWLNPWGDRIMKPVKGDGAFCTDCLSAPGNDFVTGMSIEADVNASAETKKAARALSDALTSQHLNGIGWSNSANVRFLSTRLSPPLPPDPNLIVVTIGWKP